MSDYDPQVNDYVRWEKASVTLEGWVYYRDEMDDYITIELGTKPKPYCTITRTHKHCKYHTLLLCYQHDWSKLQYIKKRNSIYDED
tara:strand:+ start:266 stop:523 length:258 start_codon:yes stop_codon:yes gene_type:complete